MAIQQITHISVYVKDQDDALAWYQDKLGLVLCEDNSELVPNFRWLTVSPENDKSTQIIIMPTQKPEDEARIGNNPMCVLRVEDCRKDCEQFKLRGVNIIDPPMEMPWGISAIIADLYGNPYNLVETRFV